jgi:hypothetical protein
MAEFEKKTKRYPPKLDRARVLTVAADRARLTTWSWMADSLEDEAIDDAAIRRLPATSEPIEVGG